MIDTLELPQVATDQPDALAAALMELASLRAYCVWLEQRNAELRKRLRLIAAEGVQS